MTKLDHKVPFPAAGKGFYFFFSMSGLAEIEDIYDADYYGDVERLLNMASAKCCIACICAGLFNQKGEPANLDFTKKQPFRIDEAAPKIMEALSLAVSGKTYAELIEEAETLRAEAAKKVQAEKEAAEAAARKAEDPFPDSEALSDTKPTDSSPA